MTKEEKEAIKHFKKYENKLVYEINEKDKKYAKTLLNLIEKLQKENEEKDKSIHRLGKNLHLVLNKIISKSNEYYYHNKITAGTNKPTEIAYVTLIELLKEIEEEL